MAADRRSARGQPAVSPQQAPEGVESDALHTIGIDLAEVAAAVSRQFGPAALARRAPTRWRFGRLRTPSTTSFSHRVRVVLEAADREARALLDDHAGGEHLVLALLATQGPTRDVLARRGISCDGARALLTGVPGR